MESIKGIGRVASAAESQLFFRAAGRVRSVNVELGQAVKKGDVVAELEVGQAGVQVEIAKVNLQVAELRLAQEARAAQLVSQTRESIVQASVASVAKAEAEHARAAAEHARSLADLENRKSQPALVQSGDERVWNAAVAVARARLDAATAPAGDAELTAAEQGLSLARAQAERAQVDLDRARAGYTAEQLRSQEGTVEAAKNSLYAVQTERDALRGRGDLSGAASAEARIAAAQASLDAATDRLRTMRAGGRPEDIAAAEKALEAARSAVTASEARLAAVRAGPDKNEVAVRERELEQTAAQAAVVRSVQASLPSAIEAGRAAAEASAAAVKSAAASVDAARAAHERTLLETKLGDRAPIDKAVAERMVDVARLNVQALEQQIEDGKLRAPRDGVLSQLSLNVGDQVQAFGPVATLADPSKLGVVLDVPSSDLAKISVGQDAIVALDTSGQNATNEKVVDVPAGITAGRPGAVDSRPVRISLAPSFGAMLGTTVNVAIVIQRKDDVLLVPATAIKRFGGRHVVQLVGSDGRRRDVEIETGITTESDIEVIAGLSEGQAVVAS